MLLAYRKYWIQLSALAVLSPFPSACASDDEPGFEVSGVYTQRSRWDDGKFDNADRSFTLSTDGTATRYRSGCPGPEVDPRELIWELEGRVVTLYERDTGDFNSRLELSTEKCIDHRFYSSRFADDGTLYVAGRYCPVDFVDFGNGGMMCVGWEPCDDVAQACVETFDRELGSE